MKLSLKNIFLY